MRSDTISILLTLGCSVLVQLHQATFGQLKIVFIINKIRAKKHSYSRVSYEREFSGKQDQCSLTIFDVIALGPMEEKTTISGAGLMPS